MMFRYDGWQQFLTFTELSPKDSYYSLGVWRGTDVEEVLGLKIPGVREEYTLGEYKYAGIVEPRVAFTKESDAFFNEDIAYGDSDNTELLYRLGIMGIWDRAKTKLRTEALKKRSNFYGQIPLASWVYKLPCSQTPVNNVQREGLRKKAKTRLLARVKHLTGIGE
jgi:hypothetical protein